MRRKRQLPRMGLIKERATAWAKVAARGGTTEAILIQLQKIEPKATGIRRARGVLGENQGHSSAKGKQKVEVT